MSTAGSSTTMAVAAGVANDSTNTTLMKLSSAISKTTASWAVGTGNGGLDTGSIANSTWYHFFEIERIDTGVVDVIFSTSAVAPTLPTNYTIYRRIGAGKTNGSSQWQKFYQNGNTFLWSDMPGLDYSATNPGTSAVTVTCTNGIPTSVRVEGIFNMQINNSASAVNAIWYISSLDVADTGPASSASPLATLMHTSNATVAGSGATQARVWTNGAQAIRSRLLSSDANVSVYLQTIGWVDLRGMN
jgi:hypothetical protein